MSNNMYDSTRPNLIPSSAAIVCVYINGRYAVDIAAVQKQFPHARILEIDVLGNAPDASIKDVENFDIPVSSVQEVCMARFQKHPNALTRLYCNLSTWPGVKDQVRGLSEAAKSNIRYWIANPTEIAHLVPGSDATQYFWGSTFDQSQYDSAWLE